MLQINGKTFMNLQEAVQWLLDNNALPFQSSANYVANTEIGLGTIVNPSPAKVRIGSLIFFADSKVSTVIGLTENGFICSDQYNNLVDDIAYVTNVAINASGHLITTLSDGQTIDAGIVKQVTGFSINASQHLIVSFNDGTSTDLGAIFNGNINIGGNLTVTGGISGNAITGNSIIENTPAGISFTKVSSDADANRSYVYASFCKNGNKITVVNALNVERLQTVSSYREYIELGTFTLPSAIADLIYPAYTDGAFGGVVGVMSVQASTTNTYFKTVNILVAKSGGVNLNFYLLGTNTLDANTVYYLRGEVTLLLSSNFAS